MLKLNKSMTKDEYFEFHDEFCQKMRTVTQAKNSDYTGGNASPFANFTQIGSIIPNAKAIEIGFLTRMSDKMSRVGSYISKGELSVKDESVIDTLHDLANYCALFAGYLEDGRRQRENSILEAATVANEVAPVTEAPPGFGVP